jgi:phosphoglycerate dehydrogenase-like enzyme
VPNPHVLTVDLHAQARTWSLTPEGEAAIHAAAPAGWTVRVVKETTVSDGDGGRGPGPEVLAAIAEAEVYFGFGITRPLFEAARRLKWVHSAAAGVGGALFPEMRESPVLLTNSAGVHAVPIAEHVVAGVMFLVRGLDVAQTLQRAGRWDKAPFVDGSAPVREMGDCRALIIGAGGLGGEIAKRFTALGTRCTGIRRRPALGTPPGFARLAEPGGDALDRELAAADILVLAAPATPETTGLITAERLDRLPREAIVVNVSRGSLLDEDSLTQRLQAGRLRGAVLDVFREEPLASSSPLWQLPQVVLTPHVSAVSPARFWERELALFGDNWRRYAAGEGARMRNLVDKRAGY